MRPFWTLLFCAGLCLPLPCFSAVVAPEPAAAEEPSAPSTPPPPPSPNEQRPWFRNSAEYIASRSVRMTQPTDVSTKIISDAKRFDMSVGKRISLYDWNPEGNYGGWSTGIDGGMLASLVRYNSEGRFTFATNTFDGYFGVYLAYGNGDGWIALFRAAHLSAHLVDNSPLFLTPVGYSQFWNEVILGHSFPEPRRPSDWDVHVQGSVGLNNTSTPRASQPRAGFGAEGGYAFHGADSLAIIGSADAYRAGVIGQSPSYTFFLGLGYLKRPQTTHRPFRVGVVHFLGSDYRNQLFFNTQRWTTFEVATEF